MKKTAVYALTPRGGGLGRSLATGMAGDLFMPSALADRYGALSFERLGDAVAANFRRYPRHVFIAAAGIVVRVIAPHLGSKGTDPAVVVLDQDGKHAISLLSGHLGGANELARETAVLTHGRPVITTATDTAGCKAADTLAKERDMAVLNIQAIKAVNMAILSGEPIQVYDPEDRLALDRDKEPPFRVDGVYQEKAWTWGQPGIRVTWRATEPADPLLQLVLHPRCLVSGIGCNKGTGSKEIVELVRGVFKDSSLALGSLKCLVSVEAKREEAGLKGAADELGVPVFFVEARELRKVRVPHPSEVVEKHMGVQSVCEAAAMVKSGQKKLLVPKRKSKNATMAVALEGSTS